MIPLEKQKATEEKEVWYFCKLLRKGMRELFVGMLLLYVLWKGKKISTLNMLSSK